MNGTFMYLLDTCIIIWILRGDQRIAHHVDTLVRNELVGASVMSIAEVYQHIFPQEIPWAEECFSSYVLYPIDQAIARHGGLYWQEFSKKFRSLSIADCLIAATARQHELTLLTLNTRHFVMPDIQVMSPLPKKT